MTPIQIQFRYFATVMMLTLSAIFPIAGVLPTALADGPCEKCIGYSYNGSLGAGDGWCGTCENIITTWTIGDCGGNDGGGCTSAEYYTVIEDVYVCNSSTAGNIAAIALSVGCSAGTFGACAAVCIVGGTFTLGAACLACIAGAGVGLTGCGCAVAELYCPCAYSHTNDSNPATGCIY